MKTSIIAGGVALAAIIGYYNYDILTHPSPAGQFARSRLGLDQRPSLTDIYSNETEYGKALCEQQRTREWVEEILRDVRNTNKPFILFLK